MKLIIAEKPSLARNIAAGIGRMTKKDGYLEGCGYLVTWAFGHLFSLADVEDYTHAGEKKWTLDNLPCCPSEFKFKLRPGDDGKEDAGVKKQFQTISYLCNREDVDTVVNAGDADREGEGKTLFLSKTRITRFSCLFRIHHIRIHIYERRT